MSLVVQEKKPSLPPGPFKPTLIIHGGAGSITRTNTPRELYEQYRTSLLNYLERSKEALDSGSSALDAACLAVSLMEDDPLFNCGRGSVFTDQGTIEMEASVMVSSVSDECSNDESGHAMQGRTKKAAAVSLVRNTRHPILLAKEVLVSADEQEGMGGTGTMHCHLSGIDVETWGWKERSLERKELDWFWTKRRWEEHQKGLRRGSAADHAMNGSGYQRDNTEVCASNSESIQDLMDLPSQGTVGAVCMDSYGHLAVATSTGGLTNKKAGRIGDTPTVGAGFWAESWDDMNGEFINDMEAEDLNSAFTFSKWSSSIADTFRDCITPQLVQQTPIYRKLESFPKYPERLSEMTYSIQSAQRSASHRRAIAMSGTGNGDSFLRTNACRTTAAICRFSAKQISLANATTAVSGPDGELQRSAGSRWGRTGEGQGGIIGIEVCSPSELALSSSRSYRGTVVSDFNCGGMWRAWYETDGTSNKDIARMMVFRDEY